MTNLLEQLESNTEALASLEERIYCTKMSNYWVIYKNEYQRQLELKWIAKIQKRVLRMRYRILENLKMETEKQMHRASQMSKELTLKSA